MAKITGSSSEKIFQLKAFLGLHQNPDGDTKLKLGEAAAMRNFRITRDGNLQRRPGTKTYTKFADNGNPVRGMWVGFVKKEEVFLAAQDGKLWKLQPETDEAPEELGAIDTTNDVHFFGFSEIVYMLNGKQYMQWDGETLKEVEGYVPLVNIAVAPDDTSRETLEQINKLTPKRRMWISPDGTGTAFKLPEKDVQSIDYVKDLATGEELVSNTYEFNLAEGSVTFKTAPAKAVNSYEIGWTVSIDFRHEVEAMRYSELYSGTQDSRVFIYGDGGHEALYSEIDYYGEPRADYFPDLNEVAVGDANTPITAMIRHYSQLICFKTNSAWAISFGLTTLADGLQTPAFYVTSTNKAIGNAALGQVPLVLNAPYTLHGNDVYEWRNTSSYTSNLSVDERQAKRISDRVYATLTEYDLRQCKCWDNNNEQEYYIAYKGRALVFNYAANAWYSYENFDAVCFACLHEVLYIGTSDGKIKSVKYEWESDDGEAIDAYWESGSMSFNQDYMRKYAAMLWIGIKPEPRGEVHVTVQTDQKSVYTEKIVTTHMATFVDADFGNWSFNTNRKPQMKKLKIKAKKFVFYKLILESNSADTTTTVLAADIRVRYTGMAK